MTSLKKAKSILKILIHLFLISGAFVFLFLNYSQKTHLFFVKNHFPWVNREGQMVYDPLYETSLSSFLIPGDILKSINGIRIIDNLVLIKTLSENLHNPIIIILSRNNKPHRFEINPTILLFQPQIFILFFPLIAMAFWFSFHNKRKGFQVSLFALQFVTVVIFSQNTFLHEMYFILFILGNAYPLYFHFEAIKLIESSQKRQFLKIAIFAVYSLVIVFQITAYIYLLFYKGSVDLLRISSILQCILNQFAFLGFGIYLTLSLKKKLKQHNFHIMEWQFSGFFLFYVPNLFFEDLPFILQGFNQKFIALASVSYLFFTSFLLFCIIARVMYKPVILRPMEDKWLYILFNLFTFLVVSNIFPDFFFVHKLSLSFEYTRMTLVLKYLFIFASFFILRSFFRFFLNSFFPNRRIYSIENDLYIYRKAHEEYYWKQRFHELERKIYSGDQSFGINHIHEFLKNFKARVVQILMNYDKKEAEIERGDTRKKELLELNQYLQNLSDRTKPIIDSPSKIEFNAFLAKVIDQFKEHPLFSCLVFQKTCEVYLSINQEEISFILYELITNALEALDSKDNFVKISVEKKWGQVSIEICDSGIGIFPNEKNKLFSPFFTSKANRLGLGLYLSRLYAAKNNGLIIYEKKGNHQTCFQVLLSLID
ncbi:MAG: sensor histidine kinase [Spirochaetales bacterium]|nr:sensor histidine kinase [Spirochaetales bacterium]